MRLHHAVLTAALAAGAVTTLPAQAALRAAPSTRATTQVELTVPRPQGQAPSPNDPKPAYIRIDYGQPHLRGRRINTDSLVPFDKVWRTGANASTTLTTDVDLVLGGRPVPKGSYVVWSLPSRDGWKLLLTKRPDAGAEARYVEADEVARVDLRTTVATAPLESFTIWLVPSTQPGAARGELRLAWGTTTLSTDWEVR